MRESPAMGRAVPREEDRPNETQSTSRTSHVPRPSARDFLRWTRQGYELACFAIRTGEKRHWQTVVRHIAGMFAALGRVL